MAEGKGLGILLGVGRPKSSEAAEAGPDEGEGDLASEGKSAAADDVFDAVKADDRTAFRSSLERFVRMCTGAYAGDDED